MLCVRQSETKRSAFAFFAFYPECAVVALYYLVANIQPDAHAREVALNALNSVETLKNFLLVFAFDAHATIGNRYFNKLTDDADVNFYLL